eukprot:14456911-Heterocapsa_arctica.AAC.1
MLPQQSGRVAARPTPKGGDAQATRLACQAAGFRRLELITDEDIRDRLLHAANSAGCGRQGDVRAVDGEHHAL